MQNTNRRICETDANHLDRCILSTGFLQYKVVTTGRLAGWARCEQTNGGYGNWFLMFVYPLYKITQLNNEFHKNLAPDNINFMCLFMHGRAAVDVIHKFTIYNNKSKFAIAFAINDNQQFHFSTSTKEKFTFKVILIHSIVFLSGNITPLPNDFDRQKERELAHIQRYISRKGKFCSETCKVSEKNIEVIIIFDHKGEFNASAIELEQEITKLRNLTQRLHFTHDVTATLSNEVFPMIDLAESEDTDTLPNISETSRKSNQFATSERESKIKSRTSTNSEELRHTEKNIESLWETVTGQCKILGSRRVTDSYDFGSSRKNQPEFLPTSLEILDSVQSITMSIMIDCNSSQTELRSRGAYDLEFDKFLANKDKK